MNLKSVNLNLILFWNPAQKYFLMTRNLSGQQLISLVTQSLGQPFRSNGIWPAIMNLKSVNLNLVLFCNPAQKWLSEIWIKFFFGMTGDLELEFTNWSMTYFLEQATLNFISVTVRAPLKAGACIYFTQFSLWLWLILQTIYVLKMEILHFLSLKSAT